MKDAIPDQNVFELTNEAGSNILGENEEKWQNGRRKTRRNMVISDSKPLTKIKSETLRIRFITRHLFIIRHISNKFKVNCEFRL